MYTSPMMRMGYCALLALCLSLSSARGQVIEDGLARIVVDQFPLDIHYYRYPPANPETFEKTLLYFHGLPTSNAIWVPLMKELSESANVESYAISYPGFGQSSAPPVVLFDYLETNLNQVPFKVANALGIERFVGVIHDVGAPLFICDAVAPRHLNRLDGLVVFDTGFNYLAGELNPVPGMQLLANLLVDESFSQETIWQIYAQIMQVGTGEDVISKYPEVVAEIANQNSQDENRQAVAQFIAGLVEDPLSLGGICADTAPTLDVLDPLLVWAPPDLMGGLLGLKRIWPSARIKTVSGARHFLMLDREDVITEIVAEYLAGL